MDHKSEEMLPSDHMPGGSIEITSFTESFSRFHIPKLTDAWPKVIDILNGDLVHDHIKTEYQEDGLAALRGIKRERFLKRQARFLESLKDLSRLLNVHLYVNGNTVTAAGTNLEQVKVIGRCYVENVRPATVVNRLNMVKDINNAERKLRALFM